MSAIPKFGKMASGNYALILESNISASDFQVIARQWINELDLSFGDMASGGNEIVWTCFKGKSKFWMSWDIWCTNISLEPQDTNSAKVVYEIGASLGVIVPNK